MTHADGGLVEWQDRALGPTDDEHRLTAAVSTRRSALAPDGNDIEVVNHN